MFCFVLFCFVFCFFIHFCSWGFLVFRGKVNLITLWRDMKNENHNFSLSNHFCLIDDQYNWYVRITYIEFLKKESSRRYMLFWYHIWSKRTEIQSFVLQLKHSSEIGTLSPYLLDKQSKFSEIRNITIATNHLLYRSIKKFLVTVTVTVKRNWIPGRLLGTRIIK